MSALDVVSMLQAHPNFHPGEPFGSLHVCSLILASSDRRCLRAECLPALVLQFRLTLQTQYALEFDAQLQLGNLVAGNLGWLGGANG